MPRNFVLSSNSNPFIFFVFCKFFVLGFHLLSFIPLFNPPFSLFTSIPIQPSPSSQSFSSRFSLRQILRFKLFIVADLALLSLLSKGEANGSQVDPDPTVVSWGWNPNKVQDDDDSWEVKAFAEDTSSIMGATWPPRSYTCTFCRREFRSAQALGGHMNVHRKDRAKLNQSHLPSPHHNPVLASSSSGPPSTLVIPTNQELASNNRLRLLYQLPHANGFFDPSKINARGLNPSSSTFVSIPPYAPNAAPYPPNTNPHRQLYPGGNIDRSTRQISREGHGTIKRVMVSKDGGKEELDLELRLGK